MHDFRTRKVWEKSHHLTLHIDAVTPQLLIEERYGLTISNRSSPSGPDSTALADQTFPVTAPLAFG